MSDLRTSFIGFYLTDREKARVQDKAEEDNRSVSDWVRNAVMSTCDGARLLSDEDLKQMLRSAKDKACGAETIVGD